MATLETGTKVSPNKPIDPVCSMVVDPEETRLVSIYKGHTYWFCAEGCRRAFEANPEKYLKPKSTKKKGWLGRYLDRMARSNEKEFGCAGPKCH